jgi:hypothetical protein
MGEKRRVLRVYDSTVVSIQHRSEEASSPVDVLAVSTLPVTAPAASPVHPKQAEFVLQSLDEYKPPIEVVSRQHDLSVINNRLIVSESHSRRPETVRRQSKHDRYPSEVSEEGISECRSVRSTCAVGRRGCRAKEIVKRA